MFSIAYFAFIYRPSKQFSHSFSKPLSTLKMKTVCGALYLCSVITCVRAQVHYLYIVETSQRGV